MAYQALYRQWRPKDFSHMVGQEAIVDTLRHQVQSGRIAHAYLFCGSRGTGKTSTAKILARAINCQNPQNGDPCGECETCRRMQSEDYLDILEMDAASNNGVDEIRELLKKAEYPPQFGAYRVYIIDEVHMLSTSAFNALLKTLEEPPEYLVFILATTEPHKLLATILSRCQRFDFGRIPAAQIQGRLREAVDAAGGEASDGALLSIARAAEGGMRDALSILDMCLGYGRKVDEVLVRQVLGTNDKNFLFRFSRALAEENPGEVILLIDELMRNGKDPQIFSRDISEHLRTMLLAKECGQEIGEILDLTEEDAREYCRESEGVSASRLMEMLDLFMHLETDFRFSGSPRVALEIVSLKCCLRTAPTDTLALNDRIAELENELQSLRDQLAQGVVVRAETAPDGAASGNTAEPPAAGARPAKKPAAGTKAAGKKKASSDTSAPTGRTPEEVWKEASDYLKKNEPGINAMLVFGKFAGAEGNVYLWNGEGCNPFFITSLNLPDRKAKIEAALTAAAGSPCTFRTVDSASAIQKTAVDQEASFVDELTDTFGAQNVVVMDELPES